MVGCGRGEVEDCGVGEGCGRVKEEFDGFGIGRLGLDGPALGGLDVDVGGGVIFGGEGCGDLGGGLEVWEDSVGGGAGDGDGRDDADGLGSVVDYAGESDGGALIRDSGRYG